MKCPTNKPTFLASELSATIHPLKGWLVGSVGIDGAVRRNLRRTWRGRSLTADFASDRGAGRRSEARRVETAWRGMSIDGVGYNLYRVRRTVHEMLKDRGYLIDQADIDLSEDSFKEKHGEVPVREAMTVLVQKRDDPTEQVYVFWPADPKVGVKPIKR